MEGAGGMKHRGAHPEDHALFAAAHHAALRSAAADLSWLMSRGYGQPSSLKLVGDRYALCARQRLAVRRCACSDQARDQRASRRVGQARVAGCAIWIDGFNVLTTVEAALAGGVILLARDGCYRDMASVHGTYRRVEETIPALRLIGRTLRSGGAGACTWYLDQPVSNSGRLKAIIERTAGDEGLDWRAEVVMNPDRELIEASDVVIATADSGVLDRCGLWMNLARDVVTKHVPGAWVVDVSGDAV